MIFCTESVQGGYLDKNKKDFMMDLMSEKIEDTDTNVKSLLKAQKCFINFFQREYSWRAVSHRAVSRKFNRHTS